MTTYETSLQPPLHPAMTIPTQLRAGTGMATASLVIGLVSLVLPVIIAVITGPLAITFGGLGMGAARRNGGAGKGRAVAGLVLGIIVTCIVVVALAAIGRRR